MTDQHKDGELRVNDTDYEGSVVIEQFNRYGRYGPGWVVPAWEEGGLGNLAGPFFTRDAAQAALSEEVSR